MWQWIQNNDTVLWCLFVASCVMFVGSLVAIPWLVARIPTNYFASVRRTRKSRGSSRVGTSWVWRIAKNVLGVLFLLAGVAMLPLPGQGVLTILMGVMLLDFPGKYRFERWLVRRPAVLTSINWLRQRSGRPPLVVEDQT